MGILNKYAREQREEACTKNAGTRLTESEYKQFKDHCDKLGLSISTAIRILILEEIK